jgi:hypothetical protein
MQDANRLAALAACGTPLAFFPEGTFTRAAGPHALPPRCIRCGRTIVVTVRPPIAPPTNMPDDFAAAIVLRDAARNAILSGCGEADMAQTSGAQEALHAA